MTGDLTPRVDEPGECVRLAAFLRRHLLAQILQVLSVMWVLPLLELPLGGLPEREVDRQLSPRGLCTAWQPEPPGGDCFGIRPGDIITGSIPPQSPASPSVRSDAYRSCHSLPYSPRHPSFGADTPFDNTLKHSLRSRAALASPRSGTGIRCDIELLSKDNVSFYHKV
jgi:hypothetical protein